MNSVIVFDSTSPINTQKIRNAMLARGYYNSWSVPINNVPTIYRLPHNMVWKPNTESKSAIEDLSLVSGSLGLIVERCIVLNSTPWNGIPGKDVSVISDNLNLI